jgi:predicted amidohydrolase YtcJ
MTHEYVIVIGATVVRGTGEPDATAIAWAHGTILAIGSDEEVTAISRGDSAVCTLDGAVVIPLDGGDDPTWPTSRELRVGGPADLAVLAADPRRTPDAADHPLAVVRAGVVVRGHLPPQRAGRSADGG